MTDTSPDPTDALVGRDTELALLLDALSDADHATGAAHLLLGDAGIGKTAMLDAVTEAAHGRGALVLSCRGMRMRSSVGFAGLHELLLPVLDLLPALPQRQRAAIEIAFGIADGTAADRLVTSIATLSLIEEAASTRTVLIVVDDLQWVDPSTADIVLFLASRLAGTRALLLATARPETGEPDVEASFTRVTALTPLGTDDAGALLARRAPELSPTARARVMAQSQGNPLALGELAAAAGDEPRADGLTARTPLTRRLERAFLTETLALPDATQRALLVASIGEDAPAFEVLAAAARLGLGSESFGPAERAGLVRTSGGRIRFRHPLISSSVHSAADPELIHEVNAALAAATADDLRRARYRAASGLGADETLARELEDVAAASSRRGATSESAALWRTAATHSPGTADRARRLAYAGEMSRQAGASASAGELTAEAEALSDDAGVRLQTARTEWMLALTVGTPARSAAELLDLAHTLGATSASASRVEVLVWAAVRCYLRVDDSPQVHDAVRAALEASQTAEGTRADVVRRIGLALMGGRPLDDVGRAIEVLRRDLGETDPTLLNCLAFAVEDTTDLEAAIGVWSAEIDLFHATGRAGDETVGLAGRSVAHVTANCLAEGLADAERALHISADLGLAVVGALAAANAARVHAARGDDVRAREALASSQALGGDHPVPRVVALAEWAQATLALGDRRPEDALAHLARTEINPPIALWAGADLAEAAVRVGRTEPVERWLEVAAAVPDPSAHLRMLIERSRALLAADDAVAAHFTAAIDHGARSRAGYDLARTHLLYGEWLRRHRRIVDAREHLFAALRGFEAHGATRWAERAAAELRAAGTVDTRVRGDVADRRAALTPQEELVADLVTRGLTNKEIADQLYLSHRTVGAHLRSVFTKVGATRRGQLVELLGSGAPAP
ncbi:LuxR family transcriptional regulator [Microbacterium awajiense]